MRPVNRVAEQVALFFAGSVTSFTEFARDSVRRHSDYGECQRACESPTAFGGDSVKEAA